MNIALFVLLLVFLSLGLVVQAVQLIYNYRGIVAAMRSIESAILRAGSSDVRSIALIPCKITASSWEEVSYTLNSLKRSLDLGYIDRGLIVIDRDDIGFLKRMGIGRDDIDVLVSRPDECTECSGKNRALIAGLKSIDPNANGREVIVMLDCDAYHHPRSVLYASKASSILGSIVTGYRWYLLKDIYSVLYNTVSSIAFEYMGISMTRIVWGGLTAMPLSVAKNLGLEEKFRKELSDDAVINREARRSGYRIVFCGKCISLTPAQKGFRSFYRWAVRQMIILRLYTPLGFKILMLIYTINTLILLLPAILVAVGTPLQILSPLIMLILGYILIGALRAFISLRNYSPESIYKEPDIEKNKKLWKYIYILISSLRAPLILSIIITARTSRRFLWRGVEYCIVDNGSRAIPCSTNTKSY
ncbi:MAG TPA: glycosyltransferase family 2 protein [Sulfolobales archaeon]|nr:glycosyltransferase family 2 protein [Sulfolobales archaeon]